MHQEDGGIKPGRETSQETRPAGVFNLDFWHSEYKKTDFCLAAWSVEFSVAEQSVTDRIAMFIQMSSNIRMQKAWIDFSVLMESSKQDDVCGLKLWKKDYRRD